ncbi:hypothetical protein QTA58_05125 [Neorhizobium sp. CSC1952]|uniref:hypothetical protein n=1 Tax=Neorhizobium sp. CSC1952 TaxID=2978974 RepID=UPI0025A5A036|nr:hypothetical protein [Rhizobium sp. CSC1952]WJR68143.1 hypothetical protein QTA58_05125 [Rhizobium sp. CSC1952]
MYMKIAFAVSLTACLVGCATTESMSRVSSYRQTVIHVPMPDDTYRLYEHKSDDSLLVAPSMSKIVSIGMAQGATLGLADTMTPEQKLEAAAQQHLTNTGRGQCKITRGYMLQKPLFEFWFECPAPLPASKT